MHYMVSCSKCRYMLTFIGRLSRRVGAEIATVVVGAILLVAGGTRGYSHARAEPGMRESGFVPRNAWPMENGVGPSGTVAHSAELGHTHSSSSAF